MLVVKIAFQGDFQSHSQGMTRENIMKTKKLVKVVRIKLCSQLEYHQCMKKVVIL